MKWHDTTRLDYTLYHHIIATFYNTSTEHLNEFLLGCILEWFATVQNCIIHGYAIGSKSQIVE